MMSGVSTSAAIAGLAVTGVIAIVAGAQALPCWETLATGDTACEKWYEANPFVCWADFTIDQPIYRAAKAARPWSEPIIQYAECSGPYKLPDENNVCNVEHTLNWQTTGTQGGGDPCPGQPGGS